MALVEYTVAEKLEFLQEWERHGWSSTVAAKRLGVPRGTLCGWRTAREDLQAATVNPSSKRVTTPGPPPPTSGFEFEIVDLVLHSHSIGESMTRASIILVCDEKIPDFASRKEVAKQSWLTRFINRHQLASAVVRSKKTKLDPHACETKRSSLPEENHLSSLPEENRLSSLPEENDLSSLPEKEHLSSLPEKELVSSLPDKRKKNTSLPNIESQSTQSKKRVTKNKPSTSSKKLKSTSATRPISAIQEPRQSNTSCEPSLPENPEASSLPENPDVSSLPEKSPTSSLPEKQDGILPENSACGSPNHPIDVDGLFENDAGFDDTRGDFICATNAICFLKDTSSRRLVVQQSDLDRLNPGKWLGDVVMSFYIREHTPPYGSTFNFDCQFFRFVHLAYVNEGRNMKLAYEKCGGITATFPWDKFEYLIIPVWMNNHWSFAVVQNPVEVFKSKTAIVHVDSTSLHDTSTVVKVLSSFFAEEKIAKWGKKHGGKWSHLRVKTSPAQSNGYDCGIFVLYFMRKVNEYFLGTAKPNLLLDIGRVCSVRRPVRFDANTIRQDIKAEILAKEILSLAEPDRA